jgi:hypothetical protein
MLKVCTSVEDQSDFHSRLDVAYPENIRSTFEGRENCTDKTGRATRARHTKCRTKHIDSAMTIPVCTVSKRSSSVWTIGESTTINSDVIVVLT